MDRLAPHAEGSPHSRSLALRTTFFLLYLIFSIAFVLLIPFGTPEGPLVHYAFQAFVFASGLLAFYFIRRSLRNSVLGLNIAASSQPSLPESPSRQQELRDYLVNRARILSALLARAAIECRRDQSQIHAGEVGLMRQHQNGLLRQHQLWSHLDKFETDLMSAPEGTWAGEKRVLATAWCEQIRLLRWVLRVDSKITPLAHIPVVEFALAAGLEPALTEVHSPLLDLSDLIVERYAALDFAILALSEMDYRGLLPTPNPELAGLAAHIRQNSHNQFLVGSSTLPELADRELTVFTIASTSREQYAAYLTAMLESASLPISFSQWLTRSKKDEVQ